MGLSKSTRILILLAIDTAFFLLELTVGYAVHSLALVADSFHMLNDVLSLLVGLWAVKVANQRTNSKEYTYGWQRAETLGALINGVFLVALCLSIFLEAIQRLVEPQDVSHPKLVVIVGSFGLASNIIGLFLFHDHGHSHGGHAHGYDEVSAAEEGHVHGVDAEDHAVADEGGNVADVLPQSRIANLPSAAPNGKSASNRTPRKSAAGKRIVKRHRRSRSRNYSTIDDVPFYPPSFRSHIIDQPRQHADDSESDGDADAVAAEDSVAEASPLLRRERGSGSQISSKKREAAEVENNVSETTSLLSQSKDSGSGSQTSPKKRDCHADHKHQQPKEESKGSKGHGHSHDLNMRGVFLHVMGDALGNIGVIGSGLFIWLTNYTWRFYADPVISLIITVIILASAIPLCTAASRILLQAVPENLSIDDIIDDITELDGIVSCHHLHVWQLSGTKLVASLHVQVDFDFKGEGSARYMDLAYQIKQCLHAYGIHSSTIQPEFCLDENHDHSSHTDESSSDEARAPKSGRNSGKASKTASVKGDEACLLTCSDACGNNKQCCDPGIKGCQGGK